MAKKVSVKNPRNSHDIPGEEIGPQRIAASKYGMIATQHFQATEVGAEILEQGGNAIDAAVAAAFALAVCEPNASGLGGQTMMLIHRAEPARTLVLDGSSRAPNRATIDLLFDKSELTRGYRATTVPSTPAVLDYARRRYGTMKLARLLEPAIRVAREGYRITQLQHDLQRQKAKGLRKGNAAQFFLRDGKRPYPAGAIFRQPVLAETLRLMTKKGIKAFYQGDIAAQIEADMIKNGGFIRRDDLARIPYPIERKPLVGRWEGRRLLTIPPPGAGRTLIEMLNILSQFPPEQYDPDTAEGALLLTEIIRRAQIDRRDRPYDPNYYAQVRNRRMLKQEYAEQVARELRPQGRKKIGETTHLSVMDCFGNAVALTGSIESDYGACVVTPTLGFLYNNYMSSFEYKEISHPYYLRPNAVPWASVAPTIIFRGKKPWLVIGSPNSERIAPSIVQVLIRLRNHSPLDAVAAPRLHCSVEGKVSLEAARMRSDIPDLLRRRGYEVSERESSSFYHGCIQLVLRRGTEFTGVADSRRDGSAAGPTSPIG
jgi:gamma-glutamyltranspeptidase/glutathione hydrolase